MQTMINTPKSTERGHCVHCGKPLVLQKTAVDKLSVWYQVYCPTCNVTTTTEYRIGQKP